MRTKNGSGLIVGVVITVFVIIIVGVVILWGSGYFTKNKKTLDSSTGKIDKVIASMAEFDLEVYDGASISGDTLKELIKDLHDDQVIVAVGVKTLGGEVTYYNQGYKDNDIVIITPTPPAPTFEPKKSEPNYINPNGTFIGEVKRNDNDEIVLLQFTQEK